MGEDEGRDRRHDLAVDEEVEVEGTRAVSRTGHAAGLALEALQEGEELLGRHAALRDGRGVPEVGLRRPSDRGRDPQPRDAQPRERPGRSLERREGGPERGGGIAQVPAEADGDDGGFEGAGADGVAYE